MSDQECEIASVCLCLQKIKDFLDDPSDPQKKEWAEDAYTLLHSLFCDGTEYVITKGCGRGALFE